MLKAFEFNHILTQNRNRRSLIIYLNFFKLLETMQEWNWSLELGSITEFTKSRHFYHRPLETTKTELDQLEISNHPSSSFCDVGWLWQWRSWSSFLCLYFSYNFLLIPLSAVSIEWKKGSRLVSLNILGLLIYTIFTNSGAKALTRLNLFKLAITWCDRGLAVSFCSLHSCIIIKR